MIITYEKHTLKIWISPYLGKISMDFFETLPEYSPHIRINSYDIPLFGEFCLSNLLMPAALCVHEQNIAAFKVSLPLLKPIHLWTFFSFSFLTSLSFVVFFAAQLNRASSDGHWTRTQPWASQWGPWLCIRNWRRIHWILETFCIILPPADNPIYFLSLLHLTLISSKTLWDVRSFL